MGRRAQADRRRGRCSTWSAVQGERSRSRRSRSPTTRSTSPRSTIDTRADRPRRHGGRSGLLNGELDLEAIGRQALNDSPAFYDPASKTVLVSRGPPDVRTSLPFRVASCDDGGTRSTSSSTGARVSPPRHRLRRFAIRATIDADALAVANTLADERRPRSVGARAARVRARSWQHRVAVAVRGDHRRTRRRRTLPSTIAMLDQPDLSGCARAGNAGQRCVCSTSVGLRQSIASPPGTQGMMFWYYVLASRIDDGQAWSAAVRWSGDSLITVDGLDQSVRRRQGRCCAIPMGQQRCWRAFQAWAATAPVESTTTVTPIEGNQVAIRACDPGATVSALLPAKVPVVFGGAAVERALVQAATSAAGTGNARRCVPGECRPSAGDGVGVAGRRLTGHRASVGRRRTSPPTSTWRSAASPPAERVDL